MGDPHGLVAGVPDQLVVELGQGLDGLAPAPGLAVHDDVAELVPLEQGLDVEHGAQQGLRPGNPPPSAEVEQVIHGEQVGDAQAEGEQDVGGLVQAHPLLPQGEGPQDQQPFTQGGGQGVHHAQPALGEFPLQLLGGDAGGLIGGADAGGGADEENVQPRLERRLQIFDKALGRDHGGGDLRALFHGMEKGGAVVSLGSQAEVLLAVDGIGQGDDHQPQPGHLGQRQTGERIGDDGKRHNSCLLVI